ncbi:MAG: PucR family transcriptional regulator [Actinobacteria bacterium]|nr:PucR family transcriptional regulator [Actinomycetota bacterium]
MTKERVDAAPIDSDPWRQVPLRLADAIEPELPAISAEIVATVGREVPEYERPLEGAFGRGLRVGVGEALRQFLELIRNPDAGREAGRDVYLQLGRGELNQGRTLDSLLSAYRIGARVAWRRVAAAAQAAGAGPAELSVLAESIFAYIDELSADSVEGYDEARTRRESARQRRRRELALLILRDPPAEEPDIRASARLADWSPPRSLAALACPQHELQALASRLPADVLTAPFEGAGCALVPDPEGPGRPAELQRALVRVPGAIGPGGPPAEARSSWAMALVALRALESGQLPAEGLVRAEAHLGELVLMQARPLVSQIEGRRLASFAALTPKARERLERTALAYLSERGNAAAMARALHVHPQTARYRLAQLRELLGDQLDDPDARFELELALRSRARTGGS